MKNELTSQEEAKKFIDETVRLWHGIQRAYFHEGTRFKQIRDERIWEQAGYSSFDALLDEEFKTSESRVSQLIGICDLFSNVPQQKLIEAGGWSNLAEIVPLVRKGEDAEKWVDLVILHTRENLRALKAEQQTGVKEEECDHHDSFIIRVCRTCGQKFRIYEEEDKTKEDFLLHKEAMGTHETVSPAAV